MITNIIVIVVVVAIINFGKMETPKKNLVRYPKVYLYLGVISLLFWFFVILLLWVDGVPIYESLFVTITFSIAILMSVAVIMIYFNIRIKYNQESFTCSNFWGRKVTFYYSDITNIYRKKRMKYYVYFEMGNKRVVIDSVYMIEYQELIDQVNKKMIEKRMNDSNRFSKKKIKKIINNSKHKK